MKNNPLMMLVQNPDELWRKPRDLGGGMLERNASKGKYVVVAYDPEREQWVERYASTKKKGWILLYSLKDKGYMYAELYSTADPSWARHLKKNPNLTGIEVTPDNYFDVADGLYWFCMEWHSGQSSVLYSVGSTLGFSPAPSANGPETEEGVYVYNELQQLAETNYRDAEDEAERLRDDINRVYEQTR